MVNDDGGMNVLLNEGTSAASETSPSFCGIRKGISWLDP